MADKTIPQLTATTEFDENSLIPMDSGIQTFKITGDDFANGLYDFLQPDKFDYPKSFGVQIQKESDDDFTVASGHTFFVPNLTILTGDLYTVPATSSLLGVNSVIIEGTLVIAGDARII